MAPKRQAPAPAPRPNRPVKATAKLAVPNPSPNSSDSVKSQHNGNKKPSSSQGSRLPDSSQPDRTQIIPAIPSVAITVDNLGGSALKEKQHNSSIGTLNDKITAGNETLAQENSAPAVSLGMGGSGSEVKVSIGQNENAIGDPNVSEVKPKKKMKKVMKVVKKVVKKRVPKSSLKGLTACSNGELGSEDCGDKISSSESISLSIQEAGIANLTGSSEDKGLEKQAEIKDHHVSGCVSEGDVGMVDSSINDPFDVKKCEDANMSVQETDSSVKLVDVAVEVENMCTMSNGKEASMSEIAVEGEKEEAFVRGILLDTEKEEASACEIPMDSEKEEGPVCEIPSVSEIPVEAEKIESIVEKSDSATEIPVELVNAVEIPVDGEKEEASVCKIPSESEIPVDAGKTESIVEKSDSSVEIPMGSVNVDSVGDRTQVVGESSGCEGRKNDNETSNGRIILSGELEALERRRRRRTEIFIGGLNTDAKEEDVRKVFEEVGDIAELRLVINAKTGRNKGYAFVRYASATDAKKALEKYSNVEICGKQCATAPVDGNDTIFLGNIDRNWKNEDVIRLLQEIGIEKIDTVTVMANPTNVERNRGFAFLELETYKDAQIAFKKLQKKDLGKLKNIKVAWAEPLTEPDEEELLKVKSVYAEYLPPSWNEEKIRSYFVKFGEIENVVLSRNLHSSRRKDFAFINFTTREAALACIESFNHETLHDGGSQVYVKVSLAKPVPKGKPQNKVSKSTTSKEFARQRQPSKYHVKPVDTRNKRTPMIHVVNQRKEDMTPTGTSELEKLLAARALRKQMQARIANEDYTRTMGNEDYTRPLPGLKRSFSALGDDLNFSDPRGYTRMRVENSFTVGRLSHGVVPSGFGMPSYYQQQRADYVSGHRYSDYPNSFQREEPPYRGSGGEYRRY